MKRKPIPDDPKEDNIGPVIDGLKHRGEITMEMIEDEVYGLPTMQCCARAGAHRRSHRVGTAKAWPRWASRRSARLRARRWPRLTQGDQLVRHGLQRSSSVIKTLLRSGT